MYARKEFQPFGEKHLKGFTYIFNMEQFMYNPGVEIQRLMCSILYTTCTTTPQKSTKLSKTQQTNDTSPLAQSPYADLAMTSLWEDVENQFTREFCSLLGLCQESPLMVTVNVGATAIPTVIKVKGLLDGRPKVEFTAINEELPVNKFLLL